MSETVVENLDEAIPPTAHEETSRAHPDDTASPESASAPDNSAPTEEPAFSLDGSAPTEEPATSLDGPTPEPTPTPTPTPLGQEPFPYSANLQNSLRLRIKVWTDPRTLKRYLMPTGFMRDLVQGKPVSDAMYAYALSADDTRVVALTAAEWNALPFFYFQEDGHAPRATAQFLP